MSFFDTYGNNGDIVSQVLSDVLLIQSALSEKVCPEKTLLYRISYFIFLKDIHSRCLFLGASFYLWGSEAIGVGNVIPCLFVFTLIIRFFCDRLGIIFIIWESVSVVL